MNDPIEIIKDLLEIIVLLETLRTIEEKKDE
nr:MAG TPA: hypothetical protein [Caudoviricetes sp.]